jgi:hypothetical protein
MKRYLALETLLLLLGGLAAAGQAAAQPSVPRQQVTLVDGSQVQGDIVEMVTQDHVTLRDTWGQVRRIAWSDIKSMGPVAPFGTPLPAPSVPAPPVVASVTWPEPDRTVPTPSESTRVQLQQVSQQLGSVFSQRELGAGLMVGAGIGFLSSGPLVADIGFEPWHWVDFEVGGGYGAHLGPALREGVRFNWAFPTYGTRLVMRITAGLSMQENFLPSSTASDPTQSYVGAPGVATWLTPFLGWDFLLWQNLGIRGEFGYGFLLNEGSYHQPCQVDSPCQSSDGPGEGILGGPTVLDVANRDIGAALNYRFEVIYRFDLGGDAPPRSTVPGYIAPVMGALQATETPRDATGNFVASGGVLGPWSMSTDRCTSAMRRGFLAAELFSRSLDDDTEVVVIGGVLDGPELLVRVPHADKMVRLRRADCRSLEGDVHQSGTRRNGVPGVEGLIHVDCALPDGGRIWGTSSFTCL